MRSASQHRIAKVFPDLAERPVADAVDGIVRPVGVRVDDALGVDVGDAEPGRISAPCFEMLAQMRNRLGWEPALRPAQEIDGIGIVVAGYDLESLTVLKLPAMRDR